MAFPNDVLQNPLGSTALQSVSLLFNATGLSAGALRPASKVVLGTTQPSARDPVTGSLLPVQVLDSLTIDVTVQETHTASSEITEHPVEEGADVTDHVRPKPIELRLEGIITDTPIDDSMLTSIARAIPGLGLGVAVVGTVQSLLAGTSLTRSAFDTLRKMRDNATPLGIFTPYRSYSNMVMETLVITRDKETGESLKFTATFREIIFVSSGKTSITLPSSAQGTLDMGTQGVPTASSKLSKSVSLLYSGANSATGGGLDAFKKWVTQ